MKMPNLPTWLIVALVFVVAWGYFNREETPESGEWFTVGKLERISA